MGRLQKQGDRDDPDDVMETGLTIDYIKQWLKCVSANGSISSRHHVIFSIYLFRGHCPYNLGPSFQRVSLECDVCSLDPFVTLQYELHWWFFKVLKVVNL